MAGAKLVFPPLSYVGAGALEQLREEMEKHSPTKIVLVTDPILFSIGVVDRVIVPLQKMGYIVDVFKDVIPEPPVNAGEKLVSFTREGGYDLVIGLGGGSALDMAKAAAVLAAHDGKLADYLNLTGTKKIEHKGLPKILIPTTSGTGSEVTNIAVFSLESTKDVITHEYLLADVAIVDPELTMTVPPRVTAATGIDALTHAIEAYLSVFANPTSDALALHAIRLAGRSLRSAVADGKDVRSRTEMSEASYMAGLAFFNAGVGGVHALAYPLGGQFHISHGESNAVLLPYVMGYIRSSCISKMADIFSALGGNPAILSEEEASIRCVEELKRLVEDVGIPTTLKGYEIPESALDSLAEDGAKQKRLLTRSPMTLQFDDIRAIYQSAFEGVVAGL